MSILEGQFFNRPTPCIIDFLHNAGQCMCVCMLFLSPKELPRRDINFEFYVTWLREW